VPRLRDGRFDGRLLGAAATLVAAGLVWAASALGVGAALDEQLRRGYYALPAPWAADAGVALVAVDDETVATWGAPPWTWDRFDALVQAILRGGPRFVAVVSPGPRLLPVGDPPASGAVARGLAAGRLLLPPPAGVAGQPRTAALDGLAVSAVALRDAGNPPRPTLLAALLERLGLAAAIRPEDAWLTVNYLGRDRPPVRLSARAVAAGAVPPAAFAGRVVLIGLTGASVADELPTPVGPLTAADVHAAAVRAALLGLAWRHPTPPLRGALVGVLLVALVVLGARARGWRATLAALGGAVALVGLDYVLHSQFAVRWGAGTPLVAVWVGLAAGRVVRRAGARHRDQAAALRVARLAESNVAGATLAEEVRSGGSRDDDEAFWRQLVKLNRLYLDVAGALLAEVAPGDWHVQVRAGHGVRPEDVREQRRDVRRPPYEAAARSGRPVWVDDFLQPALGLRTLLVPLVDGETLLGFWILHVRADRSFEAADETVVQTLAQQLSAQLAQRRRSGTPAHEAGTERVLRGFAEQQRRLAALMEQLPVGLLVATLWGEIRFRNDALQRLLASAPPDSAGPAGPTDDLAAALVRLTDLDRAQALAAMRSVLVDRPSLTLPRTRAGAGRPPLDVVLSRVAWRIGDADAGAEPAGLLTTRFVLTVSPAAPQSAAPSASRAARRPPTEPPPLPGEPAAAETEAPRGSDLPSLVRRVLVKVRHALPQDADLRLRLPDEGPLVQGDPALLVEALAGLLSTTCRLEPSQHACQVSATIGAREVRLVLHNPDHAFPPGVAPSLAALDRATVGASLSLAPPAVATGYLEACGANLVLTSAPGAGTRLEVRLPRADATPAPEDAPRGARPRTDPGGGPASTALAQEPPWTRR